jgi:nitrate/nitrite-specific signal transduction histidine kinase
MCSKIQERRDRKSDREELKGMMNATQERLDANLKDLKEEIKSGQAEMRSILCTFRSELKETIQRQTRAAIQSVQSELNETAIC